MNEMKMVYEYISPERAKRLLELNRVNRTLSRITVEAYATDIINDNWNEKVGSTISFDNNGTLVDGQHRLNAIIKADKGIYTWVCYNASDDGIYDNNRKRSCRDQIYILREDWKSVYKSSKYIAVVRALIGEVCFANGIRARVTPKTIIDFTEDNKQILDAFFPYLPRTTVPKITITVVWLACFMAFCAGVKLNSILKFYDVLCSGMSSSEEEFPIIKYREYLTRNKTTSVTNEEIRRCQFAIKKYLSKSCTQSSRVPKKTLLPISRKFNL